MSDNGDKKNKKMSKKTIKINPIYIHVALIIIIIGLIFLYYIDDLDYKFKNDDKEEIITLIGDIEEFNKTYSGDINIESKGFTLETPNSEFDVLNSKVDIDEFNGNIYLKNSTIIIQGKADRLEYSKNRINLAGQNFKLIADKKISMDLFFKNLDLDFTTGRLKINEEFNYEFEDSNIELNNFNTSFTYDGTFLLTGPMSNFSFESNSPNLKINYQNE